MNPDPEHLIDIAEAQHRAYKRVTRRLQHRRRLERAKESDPAPWLAAIRRDDATDPELAAVDRDRVPIEQAA